jgi:hypothetical protein
MEKRSIVEILKNWESFGVINTIGLWSTLEKGLLVFAISRANLEASTDPKVYNLVVDIDHLLNEINDSIQEYLTDTIYNNISDNDLIELRQEMSGYMETVNVLLRAQFDTIAYLLTGVDNDPPIAEIDGQFARAS